MSSDQTETGRSLQVSMVILTDSQSKLWGFLFSRVIKHGERRPVDRNASPPRRPQHPACCFRDMNPPPLNEDLPTLTVMNSAHLILPPDRKSVCLWATCQSGCWGGLLSDSSDLHQCLLSESLRHEEESQFDSECEILNVNKILTQNYNWTVLV